MTKNLTTLTLDQPSVTDFSLARNNLMKKAKTDWVLFLDSDEKISDNLKTEIKKAIKNDSYNYQLKRIDYFLGKKLKFGETSRIRLARLIQPKTGEWQGKVHEEFVSKLPLKTLKNPLIHQRKMNLTQFIDKINYYTTLRSEEIDRFSLLKLFIYPPLKFIHNYFIRLGFLDGCHGFIMAWMMSFHSTLVRLKTYEHQD